MTIGGGACLLFLVQFVLGKQVLPWFGGAPAVWTTCMLFFQLLLLVGYGYAHGLARLPAPRQRTIHLCMLGLAAALLVWRAAGWPSPITPTDAWKPTPGEAPVGAILVLLGVTIGVPFLVLSATGPLLQSWYARCFPGASPYRLYALSNLGSLAGLTAYPFLLEPMMGVAAQGWVWSAGFLAFAIGCAATAIQVGRTTTPLPTTRSTPPPDAGPPDAGPPAGPPDATPDATPDAGDGPSAGARALWLLLAMLASVLLLAITSQISLEVAVIPFLWMLPLALYLLSFVLCFEAEGIYRRSLWIPGLLVSAGCTAVVLLMGVHAPMLVQLGVYLTVLFTACMVCHGELVRRKPAPRHLTGFYLMVSAGGAAGGLFTGLVAPAVFPGLWELPLALVATCILALRLGLPAPGGPHPRRRRVAAGLGGVFAVALTGVMAWHAYDELADELHVSRSFFGVLRVDQVELESGESRTRLRHGRIIHGFQLVDPARAHDPTSYYGPASGVGLAIRTHARRTSGSPMRMGVVGLGVGTLATYAEPGDRVQVYEIDPDVVALSTGPQPWFTYLRDAKGEVAIEVGDARVSLERQAPQGFDVLALDAFSSDAIPAHLLTVEAMQLYLGHLRDADGIIAVHISNRYLDLDPVVRGLAEALDLAVVRIDDDDDDENSRIYASEWMLLARDARALARITADVEPEAVPDWDGPWPRWTDAYSNLVDVLDR